MSIVRTLTSSAIAALVVVTTAAGASAAPRSQDEGRGIQPLPSGYTSLSQTPEVVKAKPITDAMLELTALYAEKLGGTDASAAKAANDLEARIAAAEAKVEGLTGKPIEEFAGRPDFDAASGKAVAAFATSKQLSITHSVQSTAYWCGPASTAMAIRASGGSDTSRYNSSHKMSQTTLASSTYLQTTTSGTVMSRIPITLNKWAGIKEQLYGSPSLTNLRNLVLSAVGGYTRAVVFGTRELAGSSNPHYNFHYKTFTIDHLITGYGYTESGNVFRYADPVAGRWTDTGQSEAPHKTRTMQSSNMKGFVAAWGVVA